MSVMITELDVVKDHLDIDRTDSGEDNRLQQFLNQVEDIVFGYTGRGADLYSSADYTEFHSGTGRIRMYSRMRPLTDVTTLHIDSVGYFGKGTSGDIFSANSLLTEGSDYVPVREDESEENRGEIQAINQKFTTGQGNIKLVYTAGYTNLPNDLQFAILQLLSLVNASAEKGVTLKSETFGKYEWEAADNDSDQKSVLGNVITTLSRYLQITI